ncbi:hypothetical protein CDAR_595601 [Caerostris darwini]|uniref:Uncharacterized protein n=1 Tax=Caerostris darwini TaxID=1538125 RepID=A0AAV4P761_9ARAC|nr:hypothetical protein CDAR_595601 [Caerostris darwini]
MSNLRLLIVDWADGRSWLAGICAPNPIWTIIIIFSARDSTVFHCRPFIRKPILSEGGRAYLSVALTHPTVFVPPGNLKGAWINIPLACLGPILSLPRNSSLCFRFWTRANDIRCASDTRTNSPRSPSLWRGFNNREINFAMRNGVASRAICLDLLRAWTFS